MNKRAAVTLYGHGLSFRAVGQLLGTTTQPVLRWVISYVDEHRGKPSPEPVSVIEIDEMWHYLGRKGRKLWIWKAYDRDRGRLIDWECGARDEATFRRLFERLRRWRLRPHRRLRRRAGASSPTPAWWYRLAVTPCSAIRWTPRPRRATATSRRSP